MGAGKVRGRYKGRLQGSGGRTEQDDRSKPATNSAISQLFDRVLDALVPRVTHLCKSSDTRIWARERNVRESEEEDGHGDGWGRAAAHVTGAHTSRRRRLRERKWRPRTLNSGNLLALAVVPDDAILFMSWVVRAQQKGESGLPVDGGGGVPPPSHHSLSIPPPLLVVVSTFSCCAVLLCAVW